MVLADSRRRYVDSSTRQKNRKKFFKSVRSTMNSRVAVTRVRGSDETLCSDEEGSAKSFSAVFSVELDGALPGVDFPCCANLLSEILFTRDLIEEYLSALDSSSSPSPDELSSKTLKECAGVLSYPFSVLFRETMRTGVLPRKWLSSSIITVFKKGDKMLPDNCRRIRLTSVASKICEKIISHHIMDFSRQSNLLPSNQHRLISGRSVITNFLQCINHWTVAYDAGEPVDVIYLDFSRALDRVPHKKLLLNLEISE